MFLGSGESFVTVIYSLILEIKRRYSETKVGSNFASLYD